VNVKMPRHCDCSSLSKYCSSVERYMETDIAIAILAHDNDSIFDLT
jgi:hypothetical protein